MNKSNQIKPTIIITEIMCKEQTTTTKEWTAISSKNKSSKPRKK